jgi:hypothetical protein
VSLAAAATGGSSRPPVIPSAGATAAPSFTPAPSPAPPAPYDVLAGGGPA